MCDDVLLHLKNAAGYAYEQFIKRLDGILVYFVDNQYCPVWNTIILTLRKKNIESGVPKALSSLIDETKLFSVNFPYALSTIRIALLEKIILK